MLVTEQQPAQVEFLRPGFYGYVEENDRGETFGGGSRAKTAEKTVFIRVYIHRGDRIGLQGMGTRLTFPGDLLNHQANNH